mgnify:CR=1 FL=1
MGKVTGMERRVSKFGNSLGITMTDALRQVGLELGDTVSIDVRTAEGEIVIKKMNKVSLPDGVGTDFIESLSKVMQEYDETLKGLKDR